MRIPRASPSMQKASIHESDDNRPPVVTPSVPVSASEICSLEIQPYEFKSVLLPIGTADGRVKFKSILLAIFPDQGCYIQVQHTAATASSSTASAHRCDLIVPQQMNQSSKECYRYRRTGHRARSRHRSRSRSHRRRSIQSPDKAREYRRRRPDDDRQKASSRENIKDVGSDNRSISPSKSISRSRSRGSPSRSRDWARERRQRSPSDDRQKHRSISRDKRTKVRSPSGSISPSKSVSRSRSRRSPSRSRDWARERRRRSPSDDRQKRRSISRDKRIKVRSPSGSISPSKSVSRSRSRSHGKSCRKEKSKKSMVRVPSKSVSWSPSVKSCSRSHSPVYSLKASRSPPKSPENDYPISQRKSQKKLEVLDDFAAEKSYCREHSAVMKEPCHQDPLCQRKSQKKLKVLDDFAAEKSHCREHSAVMKEPCHQDMQAVDKSYVSSNPYDSEQDFSLSTDSSSSEVSSMNHDYTSSEDSY